MVEKGQYKVVIRVVKRGQFRLFRVVIRVDKKGQFTLVLGWLKGAD